MESKPQAVHLTCIHFDDVTKDMSSKSFEQVICALDTLIAFTYNN